MGLVPTAPVLMRTLRIRCGENFGTAFFLPTKSGQSDFLVTAAHCLESDGNPELGVYYSTNEWIRLSRSSFQVLRDLDIAFAPMRPTRNDLVLSVDRTVSAHGKEVLIPGFPATLNRYVFERTFPFIFGGRMSYVGNWSREEKEVLQKDDRKEQFVVDRPVPRGMSGAPVVVEGKKHGELCVVGVVTQSANDDTELLRFEAQCTICSFIPQKIADSCFASSRPDVAENP